MYNSPNIQVIKLPLYQNQFSPYAPVVYTISPESDVRHSYKPETNRPRGKRSSWHIKSLIASCILWVGIAIIIGDSKQHPDTSSGTYGGVFAAIYFVYLCVAMCGNRLFKYLKNIEHGERFRTEYQRIQRLSGHFVFTVESYHYQQKITTTKITDQYGNTRYQRQSKTEKVVTYRNTEYFYPDLTEDMSGGVQSIKTDTPMVFIHYLVDYRFADAASRQNFDYAWYNFKRLNSPDTHQDFDYNYTVPGLTARKCFYIGEEKPKWFLFLIICTFLGLIWPFSLLVEKKINRFNIDFLKVLTIQ